MGGGERARLVSGLDDDAATVFDLDVQVVAVQQSHTYEGCGVGGVRLDVYRPAGPEHRDIVDVEWHFTAIGESCQTSASIAQPNSATNAGVTVRNPVKPVSTTASIALACPDGPCRSRVTIGS